MNKALFSVFTLSSTTLQVGHVFFRRVALSSNLLVASECSNSTLFTNLIHCALIPQELLKFCGEMRQRPAMQQQTNTQIYRNNTKLKNGSLKSESACNAVAYGVHKHLLLFLSLYFGLNVGVFYNNKDMKQ